MELDFNRSIPAGVVVPALRRLVPWVDEPGRERDDEERPAPYRLTDEPAQAHRGGLRGDERDGAGFITQAAAALSVGRRE